MTGLEIRVSSLKGVPSSTLAELDRMFQREFGKDPIVYSDPDWFVMGFLGSELVSRVGILKRVISVNEDIVVVGGVSGVTTLPEYRRRGYARALMNTAHGFIREELPADYGLLTCDSGLKPFYEALGWKAVPVPTTFSQPHGTRTCKSLAMVLKLGRSEWPAGPIDLCGYPW